MRRLDIVTVFHNETNYAQYLQLQQAVMAAEPAGGYTFFGVDNRTVNRGFAAGCNLGASHPDGTAAVIAFLNPDCHVYGPFIDIVCSVLTSSTVITGCRFGKPAHELQIWGVSDWVCGAAMFVDRAWFTDAGQFDEQFTWSWDDTDLVRHAESEGLRCRSIELPIEHQSPQVDTPEDAAYKQHHFDRGRQRYYRKWGLGAR